MSPDDKDLPAAIMATTGKISTLSDNTLRIVVEIAPRHAKRAFELFGTQGTAVAMALLTNAAALEEGRKDMAQPAETGPHGKAWALLHKAGTWFAPELHRVLGVENDVAEMRRNGLGDTGPAIVSIVKEVLYEAYCVESTTEIDPAKFRADCRANGIEHILPREF